MGTIPAVSVESTRERVGEESFRRGEQYFREGAILDPRRQGMSLKALCAGSRPQPYRVRVDFDAQGMTGADCSCPVGEEGRCKHVAALLLTWKERPQAFIEVEEVDAALDRRSKAELIALVKVMLQREPELESLLVTPLPAPGKRRAPVDPEVYRRQAAAVFRRPYDWDDGPDIASGLLEVKALGDGFLEQKDYAAAAAAYQAVCAELLDHYDTVDDEGGDLAEVVTECVHGLGQCLAGEDRDATTREGILRALFDIYRFDIDYGGIELSGAVPDLVLNYGTAEEQRRAARWVREVLPEGEPGTRDWQRRQYGAFLLELEAETLDDEGYLQLCRETRQLNLLIERLLSLNRVDEAVREAQAVSDFDLLGMGDAFVQHGQGEVIERLMLDRTRTTQDTRLMKWMIDRYQGRDDFVAGLGMSEKVFHVQPSLEGYREVRKLAERIGRWETLRPELHALLDTPQHAGLLVDVFLDEREIDRALGLVRSGRLPSHDSGGALKVAVAAEETRPRAAVEIYRQQAERIIAARDRGNYQQACRFLVRVRALHERLGESAEWARYIADLKEQSRRLSALKRELSKAGL